jgi:hypothetical protein
MPVNLQGKTFSILDMTENLRKKQGDKYYFAYSALGGNNCQNYILELLKIPRLLTPELEKFIYQDITPIIKNIAPHTRTVSDLITNFWAWKDKLLGRGANPLGSTAHTVAYQDIRKKMKGSGMKEMEGSGLFLPRSFRSL